MTFSMSPSYGESPENARNPGINFKENVVLLAKIPPKSLLIGDSIRHDVAAGKVAYVYENKDGFNVCMNGDCGPAVDAVARGMPIISPDGNHVAAVVQKDGKSRVLLNGHLSRAYDMILAVVFSPDSMKLAYIATEGDSAFVFVNQDQHPSFFAIDPRTGLVFSSDSKHLAYVAGTRNRKMQIVYNGTPGPVFDEIRHVTFSPDGTRLVYAARQAGKWHLIEKDQKGPEYNMIHRVNFSPDSGSLVYIAQTKEGFVAVHNGKQSPVVDVIVGDPIFSNDGKRMAYSYAEKTRDGFAMRLWVDGEPGRPYDNIGAYLFSPDGKQFAYTAHKGGKQFVVHGDTEHDAYDAVGIPLFAPGGRYLVYKAQNGLELHLVKNRTKSRPFDNVTTPTFTPSGDRMAYVGDALLGATVKIDEMDWGPYPWAGEVAFSPDGKHFAWAAADEDGSFLMIDGWKGEERFFSFLKGAGLVFTDNRNLQGIALREEGTEFWLIRAAISETQ